MSLPFLDQIQTSLTDRVFAYVGNGTAWGAILTDPSLWRVLGGVGVSGATILYFFVKTLHERQKMVQEQQLHELQLEQERRRTMEEDMYG